MKHLIYSLLRKTLFLWVRTKVLSQHPLDKLDIKTETPTLYALHEKSLADSLVLQHEVLKNQLPPTEGPLAKLENTDSNYFFVKPFDPNNQLLKQVIRQIQSKHIKQVQILPVFIRWGRTPDKENSWFKALFSDAWITPGPFRKLLMILIHGKQTFVYFSQTFTLDSKLIEGLDEARAVQKINRLLMVHFRIQEETMVGPDLSHRNSLLKEVVQQEAVQQAIATDAANFKSSFKHENLQQSAIKKSTQKAHQYANEIASDYSPSVIRFLDIVLTRVWNKIYNGVEVEGVQHLREYYGSHEIVYIPCHRSHIDYLLLSYVLYKNGLALPYIAAGINLNLPIVGSILRSGSAFFIRRSFRDNPLYGTVVATYLTKLVEKGYPIEYFMEGGRSRTGRLMPPKMGMLSMTLKAGAAPKSRPIAFVPVYCGYERVIEMGSYIGELYGKQKKKESLGGLINSLKRLKENYGKVNVSFGKPILLDEFCTKDYPDWKTVATGSDAGEHAQQFSQLTSELGNTLIQSINQQANVNSSNFLSLIMLSQTNHAVSYNSLSQQIELYQEMTQHIQDKFLPSISRSERNADEIIEAGLELQLISEQEHVLGEIIKADNAQALTMTFFRNNSLHLFALPSLIACIVLNAKEIKISQIQSLCLWAYPYLQAELFIPYKESEIKNIVKEHIKFLVKKGLITKTLRSVQAPSFTDEKHKQLTLLSNAIRETLERYIIVLSFLTHNGTSKITTTELEEVSLIIAKRLTIITSINAPDYYDKTVFRSFIKTMKSQKLLSLDENDKLRFDLSNEQLNKNAKRLIDVETFQEIQNMTQVDSGIILKVIRTPKEKNSRLERLKKMSQKYQR